MAGDSASKTQYADDTFSSKHLLSRKRELEGNPDVIDAINECKSTATTSSPYFETIDGVLYRKKLEKGHINYREVLDKDRRLNAIATFHQKRPGKRHHTLEDTYRYVAENYWWEGMYFNIREYVLSCQDCRTHQGKQEGPAMCLVTKTLASHGNDVLGKLKVQWEEGLFCDITLKTGGRSFSVHRAVLAAVSEYFQEMFAEMDSTSSPQSDIDLTGFSEESLLPLLEFSYTSTLSLKLENLIEVSTMARHFRMWAVVEACKVIQSEQGATGTTCPRTEASDAGCSSEPSGPGSLEVSTSRCSSFPVSAQRAGVHGKRKCKWSGREEDQLGSFEKRPARSREPPLGDCFKLTLEQSDESRVDTQRKSPRSAIWLPRSSQLEENGLPCSPTRRLKLMDFKSPSNKRTKTPPDLSARRPPGRVLRSTHSVTLEPQLLQPKSESSLQSIGASCVRTPPTLPPTCSRRYKQRLCFPKVGQECSPVKQEPVEEEVQSPSTLEKYQLLSVLGLQRKSLLPGPEELTGWRQKKRLRKLKVDSYSLTTRRKPRALGTLPIVGTGGFNACSSSSSSSSVGGSTKKLPSSQAEERSAVFLERVIKTEPPEPVSMEEMRLTVRDCDHPATLAISRNTRSKVASLKLLLPSERRELRRSVRGQEAPLPRSGGVPKRNPVRIKQEPVAFTIATRSRHSASDCHPVESFLSLKVKRSVAKGCPLGKLSTRVTRRNMKATRYDNKQPAAKVKTKRKCDGSGKVAKHKHRELSQRALEGTAKKRGRGPANNHRAPRLLRVIKDEPTDPVPVSIPAAPLVPELGKRQSKPPMKLLDPGFLFSFCRPIVAIKKEEESVDICLTSSLSKEEPGRRRSTADIAGRTRGAVKEARASQRAARKLRLAKAAAAGAVLPKRKLAGVDSRALNGVRKPALASVGKSKVKGELPKKRLKLLPQRSRRSALLESVRRARLKQLRASRSHVPVSSHACFQCKATYRNCDALIMHRIRHIEGKHWPCPLCSKTFFRQRNVQSHIRTHDHRLYKCHRCIAASAS